MKAEFTEWVAENHPAILAKRVGALYSATPQGMTGLALRINDKGDLSDAQVTLIKAMKSKVTGCRYFPSARTYWQRCLTLI